MKSTKTALILVLVGAVMFSGGLWLYSTGKSLGLLEIGTAILVLIVVLLSLFVGLKRIKDEKKGLPVDDELSLRIKQKAGASAFSVSFILWPIILIFTMDSDLDVRIPIEIGILAMGLIFIGFWIYYSRMGLKDENQN
ncbi:hypothetical protein [Flagellimonas beolgyonensis]|jgi:uncharacterized membrane protein|uniref:hypothetical protein n=1 Tax=Flagellimonas beolgyonensis TaxID=864064 RepID=UPI000F8CB29C|nr:hypothetical protein [Allomuricauda beolgyonensis]